MTCAYRRSELRALVWVSVRRRGEHGARGERTGTRDSMRTDSPHTPGHTTASIVAAPCRVSMSDGSARPDTTADLQIGGLAAPALRRCRAALTLTGLGAFEDRKSSSFLCSLSEPARLTIGENDAHREICG